jgi:hypothetical protein
MIQNPPDAGVNFVAYSGALRLQVHKLHQLCTLASFESEST